MRNDTDSVRNGTFPRGRYLSGERVYHGGRRLIRPARSVACVQLRERPFQYNSLPMSQRPIRFVWGLSEESCRAALAPAGSSLQSFIPESKAAARSRPLAGTIRSVMKTAPALESYGFPNVLTVQK